MANANVSYRVDLAKILPWFDGGLAHLTGVLSEGQTLPRRSKRSRIVQSFATFGFGIAAGVLALPAAGSAGLAALPLAWAMAVGGARALQLGPFHHAAHDNAFDPNSRRPRKRRPNGLSITDANYALGSTISTLLLIGRFDDYAKSHVGSHHGRQTLSTCEDETLRTLRSEIGLEAGVSVHENRRKFICALVSPTVHGRLLLRRLRAQFGKGTVRERFASVGHLSAVIGFVAISGWWLPVLFGWVLPLTVGFQAAQIARFMVEHSWPEAGSADGRRNKAAYEDLTVAVRCAVPPPAAWTFGATLRWAGEMAFNIFIRSVVLPGDSGPSHGWHHAKPRGDWANHIAEAAAWEAERRAQGNPPSREAWGYREALRISLESFAKAKPEVCQ